jgi:ABC-type amino acid transport substrate-binding protein
MKNVCTGMIQMKTVTQLISVCGVIFLLFLATPTFADLIPEPAVPTEWINRVSSQIRIAVPGNIFSNLDKTKPSGIFLETMDSLLKNAGVQPTYITMSTTDALKEVNEGKLSMATVVVPVPRIKDTAYFSDPIITEFNVVVALKDRGFKLGTLSDLHGKKIGVRTEYQYPLLEKDPKMQLMHYKSDGEMLRALLFNHVDVVIIAGISDVFRFRTEGVMTRLEILDSAVGSVPLVVAFSKKQFSRANVDTFNKALATFKQGTEWKSILDRNGQSDLVKEWPLVDSTVKSEAK